MPLCDHLNASAVNLALTGDTPDSILKELISLLGLDPLSGESLRRLLLRREELGSTGIGRGVAIPHGRSPVVSDLRLAFGRHTDGLPYRAIDGKPVHFFFLIVAPPVEAGTQYLPVLGKIAQLCREAEVPARLAAMKTAGELFELLAEKGV